MAGLLSRLQKEKPKDGRSAREAVIRESDGPRTGAAELGWGGGIDDRPSRGQSPTSLLSEPSEASTSTQLQAAPASKKLIPDSTIPPPWARDPVKLSPQVEMVVLGAVNEVASLLPQLLQDSDLESTLASVVARSVAGVDADVRITVKHQEHAGQQLLGILKGFGPLAPLVQDPAVSEIYVDSHRSIKVLRGGVSIETPFKFRSVGEFQLFISALLERCGQSLSREQPIVEGVLGEGAKIFVQVLDASVVDGQEPRLCFTIPRVQQLSFFDLLQTKTLPALVAAWLAELIASREANVLVCAPARSGKSVFVNALLSAVPTDERVVVVETKPELSLPTAHVERLLASGLRPTEGHGVAELIRAGVRKNPHRLVLGEITAQSAAPFLEALEAGLTGSISSIMGASPQDSLTAFSDLVVASNVANHDAVTRRVGRAVDLIVGLRRGLGTPYLEFLGEVVGVDAGQFFVRPLVRYAGELNGKRQWRLETRRSVWLDRMKERGTVLRPGPGLIYEAPPVEEKGA